MTEKCVFVRRKSSVFPPPVLYNVAIFFDLQLRTRTKTVDAQLQMFFYKAPHPVYNVAQILKAVRSFKKTSIKLCAQHKTVVTVFFLF